MKNIYTSPKGTFVGILKVAFFVFVLLGTIKSYAQNPGDFRSATSGDWNNPTTWERYDGVGNWDLAGVGANNPGTFPIGTATGGESVFIQSTHIVTLTANQSCSDLNIAKGTGAPGNVALGNVALGINTLSVFGKLRTYANVIGVIDPPNDDAAGFNRYPFTASAGGKVSVEGLTRAISLTESGQWNATISNASIGVFPLEINLMAGESATLGTGIKVTSLVVNTGTLDAAANTIFAENGSINQGDVTVNIGGILASARTAAGTPVISRTGGATAGNFNLYGKFSLSGTNPFIEFTTITFHPGSTVEYIRSTNPPTHNLLQKTLPLSVAIPTMYQNLIKDGSRTLNISTNISIKESLTVSAGTLALGANDITMLSDATRTANLAPVTGAITYTSGRFSIERYLFLRRAWRYLATPVTIAGSPTITQSWRENEALGTNTGTSYGTRITGPGANMDETTVRGSMKSYNMTSGTFDEILTSAAYGNPIANNQGYFVFVRGDRGVAVGGTTAATTLRIRGSVRTGDQTFNVDAGKFQSVGNPYPSAIDFRSVIKTGDPGFGESFIVWNPVAAGANGLGKYETYIFNGSDYVQTPSGNIRDSIQSGEAFFIQSLTSNSSITIRETDKVGSSRLVSRDGTQGRPGVTTPTLEINLHSTDANAVEYLADGVKINFNNNYSNGLDNYDVRKLSNTSENLGIKSNDKILVVERKANLVVTDTIKLNFTNTRVANYRFEIDPSVLSNTGLDAFLKDKFLLTETPVSMTSVTNVPFAITADAASRVADRFMIVFRAAGGPLPVTFVDIAAAKNADKTNSVKWNVTNELNIQQYEIERSDRGTSFLPIGNNSAQNNTGGNYIYSFVDITPLRADNYYRIKSTSVNGEVQYSSIVKISADVKVPAIAVYPNPVEDKLVKIHFTGNANKYAVSLLNAEGKTVYTKNITVISESETQTIEVNKSFAHGNYSLLLVAEDGTKKILPIVIL